MAVSMFSCQKKKVEVTSQVNDNKMNIELIKKHLKLQEHIELSENDTDTLHLYHLTDIDINLGGQIVSQGLKNTGYKFLSDDEFTSKTKDIFEANCDCRKTVSKEHNAFITYFVNPNYEDNIAKSEYDYTYDHIFAFRNFKVISILPLLGDIVDITDGSLKINLDQKTIARNKYLFNDSKADLAWLLFNDKEFLKTLLITFGYDKEPQINKMALEDLYKTYESAFPMSTEKLGEIFFVKNCQGKLQIREGLLKYVAENTTKDDDRFIYGIGYYLNYLFNEDTRNVFDEDLRKKFTLEEKAKIVAYVCNIESPSFYKFKPMNSDKAWHNAGTKFYNITSAHPEILNIIMKNDFYGLKALKDAFESDEFINEKTNSGLPSQEDLSQSVNLKIKKSLHLHNHPTFESFSREILAKGEVEILHTTNGWDFVKIDGTTGYRPTEELIQETKEIEKQKNIQKNQRSFLADEEDLKPQKEKGFLGGLFG